MLQANDSGISSNSGRRYSSNDKVEPFLKKELLPASLAGSIDSGIGVISDLDMKRNTSHDDSNSESEVVKKSSYKVFISQAKTNKSNVRSLVFSQNASYKSEKDVTERLG